MSETDLRSKVRRSIPWTVAMGALQVALSLVSMVLLVRYLEPKEYGVWALFGALPTMVNLVISFGYGEFLLRFVPSIDDATEVGRIVWSIALRRMLLALGASALLVAGFDVYADRFDLRPYHLHLMAIQGAVVFSVGTIYLTHAMNARFMQREIVLRTFPIQVLQVALIGLGVLLRRDLFYFVAVAVGIAAAGFAFSAWIFASRYPLRATGWARVSETPEQRRYRRLSYIDEWGINFLGTDIARYLVAYFSNNVEVAIYAVATTIVTRLQFFLPFTILRPLASATFYSHYEKSGDSGELQRMFRFLYDINNLVSFLFLAIFAASGRELLALVFRETYGEAFYPVLILLAFLALHLIPVGMVAKALKRPEILIYSKVAVILNVALGIPLVIHYGATGMALATMLSVTARNVIMLAFLRRAIDLRMPWRASLRAACAALIAALVVLQLAPVLPLAAELLLAALLYAAGIRILRPLDPADRRLLDEMLPAGRSLLPWVLGH